MDLVRHSQRVKWLISREKFYTGGLYYDTDSDDPYDAEAGALRSSWWNRFDKVIFELWNALSEKAILSSEPSDRTYDKDFGG